jgi:Ca-activated chloride channel family protein
MELELTHPSLLWALLGLGLIAWGHWHTLAPFSPRRRRVSLALRSAIFILAVFAVTEPRWMQQRRETHVIWLVDVSRSAGAAAIAAAQKLAAQTTGVKSQSWIAFAGRPALAKDGSGVAEIAPTTLQDDRTDLAGGLKFTEASFPLGYARTVVLVSDGLETTGAVEAQLAGLRRADVRVHTVPAAPPERPEALVRNVSAPRQVREEEPFLLRAEIVANREMDAELEVFKSGARIGSKTEKLKTGVNRFEFVQSLKGDERLSEFTVQVRAKDDTLADNNVASAFVQSEGKSKTLLLADKPEQARYLARALRQEGILLDVRPATGAPMELGDLQNYDLVVIDNVPATDLTPAQMLLLASYVRDFGGGLLMLGGDQAFGLGGYYHTPIEEVLPVRCDFEKEQENPSLGLVLVIDRSGSMSGNKMELAKDAAKAAVELLSPRDYVGVVAFDHEAFWTSEMALATDKGGVQQRIATIQPGGGTNIAPGMELGFARLRDTPAKLKHMILLTDGVSTPGPFFELTSQMAQERITVSAVAVGGDADTKLLEQIAGWGNGRYYFTDNPQNIPQIFARETMTASKSAIQETPFLPVPVRHAEFLAGVNFDTAPFLLGYVTTKLKPTAESWLVTERGEPLLATWRYGLGQAGAFTSDARNRWAVEWLKWEGYGKFWAQLTRRLMRGQSLRNFPADMQREGDGFRMIVNAVDERGHFLADVTGEISVRDPQGRQKSLALVRTAPGRFEGWWPAPEKGGHHAQIVFKQRGEVVDRQALSASVGYPEEFLLRPMDEAKLRLISDRTRGSGSEASDVTTWGLPLAKELAGWPEAAGASREFLAALFRATGSSDGDHSQRFEIARLLLQAGAAKPRRSAPATR